MKQFALPLCVCAVPALAQQGMRGQQFIDNWDLDENGTVTAVEVAERRGDGVVTTADFGPARG